MPTTSAISKRPVWLAGVSPRGRRLIAEVVSRYGCTSLEQAASVARREPAIVARNAGDDALPDRDGIGLSLPTRQARHAKYARARTTATAGALLEALANDEMREFVLSSEYAMLRPYTADALSKWFYLLPSAAPVSQAACERLFEAGAALYLSLGTRVATLPALEALRIFNAVVAMGVGPLLFGAAFREPLREVARDATRRGLFSNFVLRARIAYLRSWTGDDGDQLRLLLDPSLVPTGLGDAYLYVRNDTRPDVFEASASLLREGRTDPARCLLKSKPEAALLGLLEFAVTRLRDAYSLRSPGYMLAMLCAVHNVREHALELRSRGLLPGGLYGVQQRLERFERVQIMEKRRFYQLFERMPEGPAKHKMHELWHRDARFSAVEVPQLR